MANASKYDLLKLLRTRSDITVETLSDLYAIKAYRRKWKVSVGVYDDPVPDNNGIYRLVKGRSSDDIKDNDNWEKLSGVVGDKHYTYPINHQIETVVQHNLEKKPAVQVVDEDGNICFPDITHIDLNHTKINFTESFTGNATFN